MAEIVNEFAVVYQGGHHTVWCDGERHKKSEGGYAACYDQDKVTNPKRFKPGEYPCDCQKWREFNAALACPKS